MSDVPPLAATLAMRRRLATGDEPAVGDPFGLLAMGAFRLILTSPDAAPPAATPAATPLTLRATADPSAAQAPDEVFASEETVMKLAPSACGPLELRIAARSGGVSVTMICASPETRNALLSLLPSLRDSLAGRGIPLLFGGVTTIAKSTRRTGDGQLDDFA